MLDEFAGEWTAAASGVGPTHSGCRQRAAHGIDSEVVQLEKFLGRSAPIPDVRLIPDLPIPGFDFALPVFLHTMLSPLKNEFRPLPVILRRVSPTGIDFVVTRPRCPMVLIRLRLDRK